MANDDEPLVDQLAVLHAQIAVGHAEVAILGTAVADHEARVRSLYSSAEAARIIDEAQLAGDRATRQSLIASGEDPDGELFWDLYHNQHTRGQETL